MKKVLPIATGLAAFLCQGSVSAWNPGTYPAPTKDLAVNRQSRNDVISFWHGVYMESEGFRSRMGWTGNYATAAGAEGTNSTAFVGDMERRLNYFRAMSGVPANAVMDTASTVVILGSDDHKPPPTTKKAAAAQRAALMMTMSHNRLTGSNPAFSHNPPVNATWTAVPWSANFRGLIALGLHGPDAITAYMREDDVNGIGAENKDAGHRRWLARATATNFATGDIPPSPDLSRLASNVLYVIQNPSENQSVAPAFVTYPNEGFFPAPLNAKFWSLSYPGAGFGSAAVSVTRVGGAAVPVTIRSRNFQAGEPAIVWEVPAEHAAKSFTEDRTYQVTVSGITGAGVPASHSYQFTFIDPDVLTSDQTLSGTSAPHPPTPATYTFTPPPQAEGLRVNTYREILFSSLETADLGAPTTIINLTSGSYPFLSSTTFSTRPAIGPIAGDRSFRLTHPTSQSPPDQIFELGRQFIPVTGTSLTFQYRRGFMFPGSKLVVETSADGGVTWVQAGATISGTKNANGNASIDPSVTAGSVPMPNSTVPLILRFRYFATADPDGFVRVFDHATFPSEPTGIFIDSIAVTNASWLEPRKANELSTNARAFTLDESTRGGPMLVGEKWHLTLQTKLGNRWFPDGPLKTVIPSDTPPLSPYEIWAGDNPGLTGGFDDDDDDDGVPNGIEYAFYTNPLSSTVFSPEIIIPPCGSVFSIRQPLAAPRAGVTYEAECSESLSGGWTSQNVTVTIADGTITATAPRPPSGRCFLRWKITSL